MAAEVLFVLGVVAVLDLVPGARGRELTGHMRAAGFKHEQAGRPVFADQRHTMPDQPSVNGVGTAISWRSSCLELEQVPDVSICFLLLFCGQSRNWLHSATPTGSRPHVARFFISTNGIGLLIPTAISERSLRRIGCCSAVGAERLPEVNVLVLPTQHDLHQRSAAGTRSNACSLGNRG